MSGIECINLLAFIQFIIAFDFGLYYLDNKHVLTEIYRKYQKDLKLSVRAVLSRANDIITESLKSEDNECILNSAYLDKAYRRLKYLTDENSTTPPMTQPMNGMNDFLFSQVDFIKLPPKVRTFGKRCYICK